MLVVDTGVRRDRGMEVEIFSRRHMEWGHQRRELGSERWEETAETWEGERSLNSQNQLHEQ